MTTPDPVVPESEIAPPGKAAEAPEDDEAAASEEDDATASEGGDPTPEERIAQLETELEAVAERHARALADYQNLQRRSAEQRLENQRLTMTAMLLNFLPLYDDLNRAIDTVAEHEDLDEHQWVAGIRLVQQKFRSVLDGAGVEQIEVDGQRFDPELHEAVGHAPGPEGRVIHVVQSGYRIIDGRVIRPAMVMVGSGEGGGEAAGDETVSDEAKSDEPRSGDGDEPNDD